MAGSGGSSQSAPRERQSLPSTGGGGGGGGRDRCGKHAADVSQSRGVGEGRGQPLPAGRGVGDSHTAGAVRRGGVWRREGRWSGDGGAGAFRRDRRNAADRGPWPAKVHPDRPDPGRRGRRNQPDWIPDRNGDRRLHSLSVARGEGEGGLFAGVSGGHRADAAHPLPDLEVGVDPPAAVPGADRVHHGRAVLRGSCRPLAGGR